MAATFLSNRSIAVHKQIGLDVDHSRLLFLFRTSGKDSHSQAGLTNLDIYLEFGIYIFHKPMQQPHGQATYYKRAP